jgi:hypothetical protein
MIIKAGKSEGTNPLFIHLDHDAACVSLYSFTYAFLVKNTLL